MNTLKLPQSTPVFDYFPALNNKFIGLLSIPHSGETIPEEFLPYLSGDTAAYKEDVDYKVNELVDIKALQEAGIAVLVAKVHRICIDLNRSEEASFMFWKQNTQGVPLVIKDADAETERLLLDKYYAPYYEMLKTIMEGLEQKKSGPVSAVDLHSMPSRPTEYHMKQNPNQGTHRADFCLSDRKGLTCQKEFIDCFDQALAKNYETIQNNPYVGGYVTEYLNKFRSNNIQIEIKREIYMDEKTKELVIDKVNKLKPLLTNALIHGFTTFDS
ncbi:MAG: N-formylglutamate amidohydrolase [Bacteriovoracaceae bacterium]